MNGWLNHHSSTGLRFALMVIFFAPPLVGEAFAIGIPPRSRSARPRPAPAPASARPCTPAATACRARSPRGGVCSACARTRHGVTRVPDCRPACGGSGTQRARGGARAAWHGGARALHLGGGCQQQQWGQARHRPRLQSPVSGPLSKFFAVKNLAHALNLNQAGAGAVRKPARRLRGVRRQREPRAALWTRVPRAGRHRGPAPCPRHPGPVPGTSGPFPFG